MSDSLALGVLDLGKRNGRRPSQALRDLRDLAVTADTAGFGRFWAAEHHVADAAESSPEIVVAALAAATRRIRVGSGGVLLRYYSPFKVAETFLTLEALYPGRIDLGVARGPGVVDERVADRLVSGNAWELAPSVFDRKVADLCQLLTPSALQPRPTPWDVSPPQVWILGSGPSSAALAVRVQRPYAVAAFVAGPRFDVAAPVRRAHEEGLPVAVAVSVTLAGSPERAAELDAESTASGSLAANLVGDAAGVAAQLRTLRNDVGADELLLTTFTTDRAAWSEQLVELAEAWRQQDPCRVSSQTA